mmetsp:Transcript_5208/g.7972  ORF Transcript_5208/g.7972 Transcript_5208/m.7972 type:complete len:236 (+) Transcript_5208:127-834(+)|eukprot:CAMPEP_0201715618 /NCGR_PEP_ID=MMETSP0593-20130828/1742_1 /ASSEMBLY_ACC=CAM_ASM_000672 /TAXON_ID=267983 /ORGANISM="Skeletonema japonicum, Strain CCMP2506" /LENGTH=235 /DNA_ID=CAMNT_0048205145 /DNA_START=101 /DNA_END=808 /DNA_ORIENTATION=-
MKTIAATTTILAVTTAVVSVTALSAPAAPIILPGEVDTTAAFATSTFPISPPDLINRAKQILGPEIGIGTQDSGACLATDFEFVAAVVGPIGREEYLDALGGFKLEESFDIEQNTFGFTVDPLQPNRVWWYGRQVSTQIAPFMGVEPAADTEELTLPPQSFHMDFTEEGLVKEFGFYTVDRRQGNTGGLGGAFGYFYGVGKPLPIRECQPYKPSFRFRMLGLIGSIGKKFSKGKE